MNLLETGVLYAAVGRTRNSTSHRFWRSKLTGQDVNLIRQSIEPIKKPAEKYNVSFVTIWRIRENKTFKSPGKLNCPHCGHGLTSNEIGQLFATLGGSISSPRKAKASAANGRKVSKLTEEDIANIRQSNASTREFARKYKVLLATIRRIKRNGG